MTKRKPQTSRVMRASAANYARINALKPAFARKHGLKRCTYDQILEQALAVAQALLEGRELYVADGKAYLDLAEARGEAIRRAVRAGSVPDWPLVCIAIGQDDGLKR